MSEFTEPTEVDVLSDRHTFRDASDKALRILTVVECHRLWSCRIMKMFVAPSTSPGSRGWESLIEVSCSEEDAGCHPAARVEPLRLFVLWLVLWPACWHPVDVEVRLYFA